MFGVSNRIHPGSTKQIPRISDWIEGSACLPSTTVWSITKNYSFHNRPFPFQFHHRNNFDGLLGCATILTSKDSSSFLPLNYLFSPISTNSTNKRHWLHHYRTKSFNSNDENKDVANILYIFSLHDISSFFRTKENIYFINSNKFQKSSNYFHISSVVFIIIIEQNLPLGVNTELGTRKDPTIYLNLSTPSPLSFKLLIHIDNFKDLLLIPVRNDIIIDHLNAKNVLELSIQELQHAVLVRHFQFQTRNVRVMKFSCPPFTS